MSSTTHFHVAELLESSRDQTSFHIASERHMRIQFLQLQAGAELRPYGWPGDLLICCWAGSFTIHVDGAPYAIEPAGQVLAAEGQQFAISCHHTGWLQLIWAPGMSGQHQRLGAAR